MLFCKGLPSGSARLLFCGRLLSVFPESSHVNGEIEYANSYARHREQRVRNIRIDQRIHIMQQKSTLVRLDSTPAFEPVFQGCQRAVPRHDLGENTPEQG